MTNSVHSDPTLANEASRSVQSGTQDNNPAGSRQSRAADFPPRPPSTLSRSSSNPNPPARLNQSPVWQYVERFIKKTKGHDKEYVRCKVILPDEQTCGHELVYSNTTGIRNHLLIVHDLVVTNESNKTEPKLENNRTRLIHVALLKFIIMAFLPFCLVEYIFFLDFCKLLNDAYKPPSRQTLAGIQKA